MAVANLVRDRGSVAMPVQGGNPTKLDRAVREIFPCSEGIFHRFGESYCCMEPFW